MSKQQQSSCKNLELEDLTEVPITQEQYNQIINMQEDILGMIADGEESTMILDTLCLLAEKLLSNAVASIMLRDPAIGTLSVIAAPSIPEVGHRALAGLHPGEHAGSCGNAVFRNEPQYVVNTFEDPRWEDLRKLAYDFNLCSCWSMPIRDQNSKAIGSFALSSFEHRSPSGFHKKLLEIGAKIVSIVLKNIQKDQTIKLFSLASQNASEGMMITDENNKIIEVNQAFRNIYKYENKDLIGQDPKVLASKKQSKEFYKTMWDSLDKTSKWAGEIINVNAYGEEIVQWLSISILEAPHN
ncbi:MAG: PAS domain S-box protein, partial [Sulfurimonas sp.]